MKYIKSFEWIRLRGQHGANNEICKIDTKISDKERAFFIPETDAEKTFFDLDTMLNITFIPYGPTSHDPEGPWGWRLYSDRTEDDMKKFAENIELYVKNLYENSMKAFLQNRKGDQVLN